MSRTPLFRLLRRAAATASLASQRSLPLDEVIQASAEARGESWARRRFLRDIALGAAGLGLVACAPRSVKPTSSRRSDVVIVGAGIAGLSVATRLRDEFGIAATIYEAQDRVGGRMLSLRGFFPDNQVCELGGELIDSGHLRMRNLAQQLGLVLDDLLDEPAGLASDTFYFEGRRHSEAEIVQAFAPLARIIRDVADTLPEAGTSVDDAAAGAAIDALSISAWLDQQGCSGWLRALIETAYTTEMGLDCDEQSALNLIDFIGTDDQHFRIFGESDERYHVRGGNDAIPQTLANSLGGAIQTGCALEAISRYADGRYRLSFQCGHSSFEVSADQVVLAIPLTTLRRVSLDLELPAATRRTIESLGYGNNSKLMIGFAERIWRQQHASNGSLFTDLLPQSTWETSRQQAGAHGILTNFTGGRHALDLCQGQPKAHAAAAVAALESIYPGLAASRADMREVRMAWPTHPWSRGSYACYRPGQWSTLRGVLKSSIDRLHFAGEHCADDNQGFMEGGLESGQAVAQAVAKQAVSRV